MGNELTNGYSLPPTRQHPGWVLISAIRQFRGLVIPVAILIWSRGARGDGGGLLVFGLLTAGALLWQVICWLTLTYEVRDGRLIVRSGVLARRERFVPMERIQAVDLSDTPLQRMLGLATVRIETAASGAKEADIRLEAVRRDEAEGLRAELLSARGWQAAEEPEPPLFALSGRDVLVAGATSGRIAPAIAVLIFAAQLANEVLPDGVWMRLLDRVPGVGVWGALALALAGAALAWGIAILGAALTWSGFELRREGERLLITHGLLDRRRTSVPLSRVQAVAIREGMLRRPFGLAEVTFTSAGWGREGKDAGTLAPLIPAAAAPALIAAATPAFSLPATTPALSGPPPRALGGFVLASLRPVALLAAAAVVVAAWLPQAAWWWGLLALAGAPVALLQAWFARRDTGAGLAGGRFLLREGGLNRSLTVTVPARVQWRGTAQSLPMRRSRLAHLRVGIARGTRGGERRVRWLMAQDVARLVAELAEFPGSGRDDGYTVRAIAAPDAAQRIDDATDEDEDR